MAHMSHGSKIKLAWKLRFKLASEKMASHLFFKLKEDKQYGTANLSDYLMIEYMVVGVVIFLPWWRKLVLYACKYTSCVWTFTGKHIFQAKVAASLFGVGAAGVLLGLESSVKAERLTLHPPKYEWPHTGIYSSLDAASVRRGYQVYKQVYLSSENDWI